MTARGLSLGHNGTGCVDPGGQKHTVMTGGYRASTRYHISCSSAPLQAMTEPHTGGTTYSTVDLEDAATVALCQPVTGLILALFTNLDLLLILRSLA